MNLIRGSQAATVTVTEKADRDLVSDVDIAVERTVRDYLHQVTPDIAFLGEEEGGPDNLGTGWIWALDPIDGTSNFAHGIPLCAASLALMRDGSPVLGVIGDYATGPEPPARTRPSSPRPSQLTPRVHRIRMLGTAALDLAWVAPLIPLLQTASSKSDDEKTALPRTVTWAGS